MKQNKFIKLDYIPGLSLTKFVKVLKQKGVKCFKIMYGIARAIKTITDANVAHRDITQYNIIVDFNYEPHIIDFGESRAEEEGEIISICTLPKGTSIYIPAEGTGINRKYYVKYYDMYSFSVSIQCAFFGHFDKTPTPNKLKELCGEKIAAFLIDAMNDKPNERPTPDEACKRIIKIAKETLGRTEFIEFCKYHDYLEYPIYDIDSILLGKEENLEKLKKMEYFLFYSRLMNRLYSKKQYSSLHSKIALLFYFIFFTCYSLL